MQVSFSETYNIVAADFVNNFIPVVVSRQISWLPEVVMAEPTNTEEIAARLSFVWRFRNLGIKSICRSRLASSNKIAERIWIETLGYSYGKTKKRLYPR
jgi:hypothetical protein